MPKRKPVTFEMVRRLALAFPAVEEETSYGTPAFRVCGKFLARLREDGESLAIKCGFDERDLRIQVDPGDLRDVLEQAWRLHAPKRLLAMHDRSQ